MPLKILAGASLMLAWLCLCLAGCWVVSLRNADSGLPGSIVHEGRERSFRLHLPAGYDGEEPGPLLLALHGGGGSGKQMDKLTGGLNQLADRQGFVVAYPDGLDEHWNDGRAVNRSATDDADDVGFLSALVDHLVSQYAIDPGRVYAVGISNGGMMALRLACERPDKFSAVALVASAMSEALAARCAPERPISVLVIGGTKDPLVPWDGGEVGVLRQKRGRVLSVPDTIRFWVAHNQCEPTPTITQEPDRKRLDGTRVSRQAYGPCAEGTEVLLYAVEGGGHTWPGGWQYLPALIVGRTSRDIEANQVIWQFLERH